MSNDDEGDDILKLDATAEEDEFSAFLNEFEDEVLSKKEDKKNTKKEKKVRPPTEKKVVDGKKLRKKIKPKKATPPPAERRSSSPRLARSPGRRYFSPNRGKEGKFSPRRREDRGSQDRQRSNKSKDRDRTERSSKSKEKTVKETKVVESAAERAEREQREYEERLAKLPSPERERMEARRRKFEKKIDTNKKISLKKDKSDGDINFDLKKRNNKASADRDVKEDSPPVKRNVTDLRVQLHKKKRKAQDGEVADLNSKLKRKNPLMRSVSPSPEAPEVVEAEELEAVERSGRRKVVASKTLKKTIRHSEEESDRSPSPPSKLTTKRMKSSSGDSLGRRILVVRKEAASDPEDDFSITRTAKVSPNKGLK